MTKAQTKAVAVTEPTTIDLSHYAALDLASTELAELFAENFGTDGFDPFALTTLKVPSGGGTQWEIEGLDGPEYSPDITGVIVGIQKTRKYWEAGLEEGGGGTPPDCQSSDLETGIGTPGGLCEYCPMNEFGSAGAGKACKESWRLFVLQADSIVPVVVNTPATSLRAVRKYQLQLTSKRIRYYNVVTRFTLERDKSQSGIQYSRIKLEFAGKIDAESMASIAHYVSNFKPLIAGRDAHAESPATDSPNKAIMDRMRDRMRTRDAATAHDVEAEAAALLGGEVVSDPEFGVEMETRIPE